METQGRGGKIGSDNNAFLFWGGASTSFQSWDIDLLVLNGQPSIRTFLASSF